MFGPDSQDTVQQNRPGCRSGQRRSALRIWSFLQAIPLCMQNMLSARIRILIVHNAVVVEAKGSVIFSISNKGDQRGEFIMVGRLRGQNHASGAVLQKEYANPLYISVDPICSDCGKES